MFAITKKLSDMNKLGMFMYDESDAKIVALRIWNSEE